MQYEMLGKFKEKILNEKILESFGRYNDVYLLGFLRARKFDLENSFLLFKDFIKWRHTHGVDQIEV